MRSVYYIIIVFSILPFCSFCQDTSNVFTQDQFLWYVKNFHPISIQSDLLINNGESTIRTARGAFDPYIHSNLDQKTFQEKNYFHILNGGLKVPTWYGIEFKSGIDRNSGVFLNPENNVPSSGLVYAGISVPIGQGLFIDKRRASLFQAKLYAKSTLAEQQKVLNDLYFDAIQEYWAWTDAWNQLQVYKEAVQLSIARFEAVKSSFAFGENPAIDTLEAFIQVQNWQFKLNQAALNYQNTTLFLSNFLWIDDQKPLVITESLKPLSVEKIKLPDAYSQIELDDIILRLASTHPEMQLYDYKLASLDVEKRLKTEGLKPKINLNYNLINEPIGSDILSGLSTQNYKWGIEFSFPIFLRQLRGELQLTKLKIQETELDQKQKLLEFKNKVRSYYNEQLNLQQQLVLFKSTVVNIRNLLLGERQKFDSGESSIFLINSREANLVSAQIKLIELTTKYNIYSNGLLWATGTLAP